MRNKHNNEYSDHKRNILSGNRSVIIFLLVLLFSVLLFLVFQKIITRNLSIFIDSHIGDISKLWLVISFYLFILFFSGYILYRKVKYSILPSKLTMFVLIYSAGIYSYYRVVDDSFVFWGYQALVGHVTYFDLIFLPLCISILCYVFPASFSKLENVSNESLIKDDLPIEGASMDWFGYDVIARNLLADLETLELKKHSFSVGISGEWGLGKSSFLAIFREFAKEQDRIVIEFFPRASSSQEHIQEDFLYHFARELNVYDNNINRRISKYVRALKLVEKGLILDGFWNAFELSDAGEVKETIDSTLSHIGKKVYVLIDDLDRLTASELLEVFKLINRNADFPNTVFISAYDKQYVNSIMRKQIGYDVEACYTDKYFNYELALPVQKKSVLERKLYVFLSNQFKTSLPWSFAKRFDEDWMRTKPFILEELTTVRHIKRFLNIFTSRYKYVQGDLNFGDLLLLTLIRYSNVNVYDSIAKLQIVTKDQTVVYLKNDYRESLRIYSVSDNILSILKVLFPFSSNVQEKNCYSYIRSTSSFDFYFYDDLTNRLSGEQLNSLVSEPDEEAAVSKCEVYLKSRENTQLIIDYLSYVEANEISGPNDFRRYVILNLCGFNFWGKEERDFYTNLLDVFSKRAFTTYFRIGLLDDIDTYRRFVFDLTNSVSDKFSYSMALLSNSVLNEFDRSDNSLYSYIFDIDQWQEIFSKALTKYSQTDYIPMKLVDLANVHLNGGRVLMQSCTIMYEHVQRFPERFAPTMLLVQLPDRIVSPKLVISFYHMEFWKQIFDPWESTFPAWLNVLDNVSLSRILGLLYELELRDTKEKKIVVDSIDSSIRIDDYDFLWTLIQRSDKYKSSVNSL